MDGRTKVVDSREAFSGRVFRVRVDTVRIEGTQGRVDVVEHGGSVAILACPEPGQLVLVRQYRHPARRALWEIPAGTMEPDEEPVAAAARELAEETGLIAARVTPLYTAWVTPGFCTERMHLFLADGLTAGAQHLDADEHIEVGTFTLDQAWAIAKQGDSADMKTLLALLWMSARA